MGLGPPICAECWLSQIYNDMHRWHCPQCGKSEPSTHLFMLSHEQLIHVSCHDYTRLRREIEKLHTENSALRDVMYRVEPYLDAIICYASSMDEHEPNRIAYDFRNLIKPAENKE